MVVNAHDHAWAPPGEYAWHSENTPDGVESMVYTAENLRADMAEHGIDRTCLVATPIHGRGSPYTLDCIREHPEFYGVLLLDYFADDVAERVEAAFELDRVLGVRLGARLAYDSLWERADPDADWIVDEALGPFWAAMEAHADRNPQVQLFAEPEQFDQVEAVVADHPDLTFVIDHLGCPTPGVHEPGEPPYSRIEDIAGHSNAHVKITQTPSERPVPFEDIHGHVRYLLEVFGSERCLWGSDYIYHFKKTTFHGSRQFLDRLDVLTERDRRNLLGRTFDSLLA
jgi:L-fuconolactonase